MHVKINHSANNNGNSNIIINNNNINSNSGMPWLAPFLTSPPKEESFKINLICLPGLLEKGTQDLSSAADEPLRTSRQGGSGPW